ncbi:MAG TPA: hypothetical protein VF862_13020 [Gemmatimonadales bacterium]
MRNALFVSIAFAVACAPAAEPPAAADFAPDSAAALAAAQELGRQYAERIVTGDAASVAGLFTEDATTAYFGYPTTSGRANIQALYAASIASAGKPTGSQIAVTSATGVTPGLITVLGTNAETRDSAGVMVTQHWRWAAAVRKDADGQWRFAYSMAFPDSTTRK